nr:VOC family protein [Algoriphagus sp. AK58]
MDVDDIRSNQKVVPCLLFVNEKRNEVKNAILHYTGIFKNSKILMEAPYPLEAGLPEGTLLFAQVKLGEYLLNAMSSTLPHDFDFSPGNSLVVECETQEEIDHFWANLGSNGQYYQCGWLSDQFGVSWQILPTILSKLMTDPVRSRKVIETFQNIQKFDIKALLEA